jgi:hypothetical protein
LEIKLITVKEIKQRYEESLQKTTFKRMKLLKISIEEVPGDDEDNLKLFLNKETILKGKGKEVLKHFHILEIKNNLF